MRTYVLLASLISLFCTPATAFGQLSGFYDGSLLRGKTGSAGDAGIDKIVINPAHTANLPASEISLAWGIATEEYNQRYPGFDAHTSKDTGMMTPIPAAVLKVTPSFGISAIILPFPIGQDIEKSDIPLIILGQENSVDFVGRGQVDFLAFAVAGFSLNEFFSLGAQFSYIKAGGDFKLLTPGISEPLATVGADVTTLNSRFGVLFSIGSMINIGLSAGLYSSSSTSVSFDSSLTELAKEEGGAASAAGNDSSSSSFLNPLRLGIGFFPTSHIELALDLQYDRASPRDDFSIVDLTTKPKDVYSTLSVYTSAAITLKNDFSILAGYLYEPSAVGPGTPGKDGKAGFGFTDILLNLGEMPSRPQWNVGLGIRKGFGKKKKNGKGQPVYQKLEVEGGIAYGETSIGINANGEQPGAYLARRTRFPFSLTYRF